MKPSKKRKVIFIIGGTISIIIGASLIILSPFVKSLNPTYLGYVGGVVMIGYGAYLWLWEISHKPN
jgi:uncharacterized membrane protein